jgi:hypothetical protein
MTLNRYFSKEKVTVSLRAEGGAKVKQGVEIYSA